VGEDPTFSVPVKVDLATLFKKIQLSQCEEMSLTAVEKVGEVVLETGDTFIHVSRCLPLSLSS
jgi:hypothetical protein